ncbi:MAG: ABC transporter ATP-binding protein [Myxococcota bacterium]
MSILELKGVTKRFGSRQALSSVDLHLPEGSSLGLLGPNGAGKTTVLRLILGLASPTEGRVQLQGLDPEQAESRKGVGYLPERVLLPGRLSVRHFLEVHARLAGLEAGAVADEVKRVTEQVGISDRLSERISTLSKGLAQRVGFAQAFLSRPRVLLLDEPSSGLDPIGMREVRDWIQAVHEQGCSVLLSSHLLSEVERVCDRVAILHEGRVIEEGKTSEIVHDGEALEDAFIRLIKGGPSSQGVGES